MRTVEQILGIPAMNQEDHSATPMYSTFTDRPNFAPYDALPNQVPLTLGAPGYPSTQASTATAKATTAVPAAQRQVYDAWMAWSHHERFDGRKAVQDYAKPALLNRLDWYSSHNWKVAYPGDLKIYAPDQVPGRNLPSEDIGDG